MRDEVNFWFTSTPDDAQELWPMLIEKAYAKKYGSYSNIAGGFVDLALAELTNGIPETMEKEDNPNLEKWWNQLLDLHKQGIFLGAGSPSHADGDSATSPTGIVQGHAYSILKLI
jgi:calpain-15